MTTYNEDRFNRGMDLIRAYDRMRGVETGASTYQHLTDMLADLRHMAHEYGEDFGRALSLSELHFDAEITDEDEEEEADDEENKKDWQLT